MGRLETISQGGRTVGGTSSFVMGQLVENMAKKREEKR